jgi:protein-tyrosine phosphatase
MGEGILKHLVARQGLAGKVEVRSAGTWTESGRVASEYAVLASANAGLHIETHRSTMLNPELIRQSDLILTMEPAHREEVLAQDPTAEARAHVLTLYADPDAGDPAGVEDPIGGSAEAYRSTFEEIEDLLRIAMPRILSALERRENAGAPQVKE